MFPFDYEWIRSKGSSWMAPDSDKSSQTRSPEDLVSIPLPFVKTASEMVGVELFIQPYSCRYIWNAILPLRSYLSSLTGLINLHQLFLPTMVTSSSLKSSRTYTAFSVSFDPSQHKHFSGISAAERTSYYLN